MDWHYFDRRLNRDGISRAFASKEDALREACYLMRQNCRVHFVKGPNDEKMAFCSGSRRAIGTRSLATLHRGLSADI